MGKKGRKTRWRTLTITDEHSDSEESNTTTSSRVPKGYPPKSYYGRFTYSSQSTPTRRFQCDGTKSTRSSSTASENKITFNEDEYTRITTPRQDVLFKKGYLNKPKTYQTQTSTGNSTTSTGNSTGNGTPDHQSTDFADLEYESQFVFPNGFVDQNGIYYVNSFEPYPVMLFNPPTYYPDYTNYKTKRCSTGSLPESASPNNEETSQDLSQSNVSDANHAHDVVHPDFCHDGACQPQDAVEPRRLKKRRRRKVSRSKSQEEEATTTAESSSDEVFTEEEDEEEASDEEKTSKHEEIKDEEDTKSKAKYDLKPDAEEFVPRAYRHPETIPVEANVHFIKIPPNFVPVPILNPMEFNAFMGYPINFVPPNYVNFVPYKTPNEHIEEETEEVKETVEVPKTNQIDIAKIVSKLEEAAKEQEDETVKEEAQAKSLPKRKHKFQKVELRKPPPSPEKKQPSGLKKEESPHKSMRNYSETLKKAMGVSGCERHERHMEKMRVNKGAVKEAVVRNHQRVERTPTKITGEWIPVSSRKKRKNKNIEETEGFDSQVDNVILPEQIEEIEIEEVIKSDSIPPPQKIEENIENISPPDKAEEITESIPLPEDIDESGISLEEINNVEEEMKVEENLVTVEPSLPPLPPPTEEVAPEEKKAKKKTKKKTPPIPLTKRVIIKDIDLRLDSKIEETKSIEKEPEEKIVSEVVTEAVISAEEVPIEKKESLEKKSKKKKKKVTKTTIESSESSSNNTSNVNDDSYDFLLDESLDKTNVEVSQELDKMIQRGMYSNLEEKIKLMNIESNDSFFKTIISNISSRESSVEKNHPYMKSPDLSKILTTTTTLSRPTPTPPKPSDFLGESATPAPAGGGDDEHLYPITKAVKEWMTKTREATPEVEILKSPSTILREFGEEEKERKTSVSSIEEGEDVLETMIEEEKGSNPPKHGNLPYRAICCSIM